ncbi:MULTISPECIES: DCC1-like thiol-disulfide oxidoreductase family protein [Corynebacterium]|uniref:DCC1-like thiol-disulfide oxidoreductase family protein n=1 Tax=Corynebacterium TaxID=1716 RepID=UPI0008A164C7|nr:MULTISPECIES: DCC1-like thiol-disulfide oxidoreductase family protein [Corynebacterium]MBU5625256.1 DUF393 domain-containing protein [Corynebacterium amycolatum]MCQ9166703.1 DUF393 domain-containing protein [Corynebacterium amycolatum]MCQ9174230.1 DUF393 domain-containing protein [Corynebacterium amycolatum]OFN09855.1 hypothetical protein HMPREF2614_00130 [Corynebacterium sp. HMSC074C11]OMQ04472.1 hypothetical protein BXT90_10025 [Corynebacterium amycolatum]
MNPDITLHPDITFYYDRDCGFCEASVTLLAKLSRVRMIGPSPEDQSLPAEVRQHISAEAVAMIPAEAAVVEPGVKSARKFWYGHEAIGIALREGGTKTLFRCAGTLLLFPPLTKLWSSIYKVVASNRHKISAVLGLKACKLDSAR